MSELRQRTNKSNGASSSESNGVTHGDSHTHGHAKSLSLSSILHTHTHSHGEEDEGEEHGGEAQMILDALRGRGDAGSRVTLIGLGANIGLTLVKGVAGWYLNSASLLADAGHSLSDLIADLVTLTTLIISSRPPSPLYPLGYGKLESLGTLVVSIFLLLGGIGIGAHSFTMLSEELSHNTHVPKWLIQLLASFSIFGDHDHGHHGHDEEEGSLSAAAIIFPIIGLLVKEWLYRITKKVADEQNSSVLMANALHHRSDAFTGVITVIAIAGSVVLKGLPVDPLGGVFVALLILHSSIGIFKSSIFELTDASVPTSTLTAYQNITRPQPSDSVLRIDNLRAVRSGSNVFVDAEITLRDGLSALQAAEAIEGLKAKLRDSRREVKEVRVSFTIGQ